MQCLSFTQELVSVLTISNTLKIINFEGKDGVVLAATGDLFKSLWSKDSVKRIFPRKFKKTFGQKNIQFSDKTQEDAH
jgi:ubiquitin C-terminal hydrolase